MKEIKLTLINRVKPHGKMGSKEKQKQIKGKKLTKKLTERKRKNNGEIKKRMKERKEWVMDKEENERN